jgi:hypothetical protein
MSNYFTPNLKSPYFMGISCGMIVFFLLDAAQHRRLGSLSFISSVGRYAQALVIFFNQSFL